MSENNEGSGETARMPSLVAYVISTIISCTGKFIFFIVLNSIILVPLYEHGSFAV